MKKILLVMALVASNACLAEIYKWTDSNGKTHYSDSPPPGQIKQAQEPPLPPPPSVPVEAPVPEDDSGEYALTSKERARAYQNLSLRSVPTNGVSQQGLYSFFNQILDACNSRQPSAYFALVSAPMKAVMLKMPAAKQRQLFSLYCDGVSKANSAIGGRPEGGIHSVEQEKNRTDNGVNVSYWYIRTKQGELVFRMKVIFENGRLKINDH